MLDHFRRRTLAIISSILIFMVLTAYSGQMMHLAIAAQTPPTLSIATVQKAEGDSGDTTVFTFVVTRTGDLSSETTVDYETQDDTATLANSDYVAASGTLTFAASDDSESFDVNVTGDDDVESDEFFRVHLFNEVNATISQDTIQAVILNDDSAGTITLNRTSVNVTEGGSSATVKFTLDQEPTANVSIDLSPGGECSVTPTTVELNNVNWSSGVTITISAINDTKVEGDHTCIIATNNSVSTDARYNNLSVPDITVNITDNDGAVTNTPTRTPTPGPSPTPYTPTPVPPTATPVPTATPIPHVGNVSNEIRGLAVRTGPYLGATLIGSISPGFEYDILAQNTDEGGDFAWYLVQVNESVSGWVSGRYLLLPQGLQPLVGYQGSIFDQIDGAPDVGVYGTTFTLTDLRRRPSGRAQILRSVPAGARVSIIGRTRQNGGDFWYQVRYEDQVGWIPAYVGHGDTSAVPIR